MDRGTLVTPELIDHSGWIEALLQEIKLYYLKGEETIRIFGYLPRYLKFMDQNVAD